MEAKNEMIAPLRNEDEFREELRYLIYNLDIDEELGAHDFVLADYLIRCLKNLALFIAIEKNLDQPNKTDSVHIL